MKLNLIVLFSLCFMSGGLYAANQGPSELTPEDKAPIAIRAAEILASNRNPQIALSSIRLATLARQDPRFAVRAQAVFDACAPLRPPNGTPIFAHRLTIRAVYDAIVAAQNGQ